MTSTLTVRSRLGTVDHGKCSCHLLLFFPAWDYEDFNQLCPVLFIDQFDVVADTAHRSLGGVKGMMETLVLDIANRKNYIALVLFQQSGGLQGGVVLEWSWWDEIPGSCRGRVL